jgi:hypothetical protein
MRMVANRNANTVIKPIAAMGSSSSSISRRILIEELFLGECVGYDPTLTELPLSLTKGPDVTQDVSHSSSKHYKTQLPIPAFPAVTNINFVFSKSRHCSPSPGISSCMQVHDGVQENTRNNCPCFYLLC